MLAGDAGNTLATFGLAGVNVFTFGLTFYLIVFETIPEAYNHIMEDVDSVTEVGEDQGDLDNKAKALAAEETGTHLLMEKGESAPPGGLFGNCQNAQNNFAECSDVA